MAFDISESTGTYDYGEWQDFYSAVSLDPNTYGSVNTTNGYLRLSPSGCVVPGSKPQAWDCNAACLNTTTGPELVWGNKDYNSMYTLQNCVVLPAIMALLAGGNLTANGVKVAAKYGIVGNASLIQTPAQAWPVISGCIDAYCKSGGEGGPPTPGCERGNSDDYAKYVILPSETYYNGKGAWDAAGEDYWWPENFTFSGVDAFNSGLCHNLTAFINSDIGGIGMFVSYLMQTFIVLSAWLLFHIYSNWSTYPIFLALVARHGHRRASDLAQEKQAKIAKGYSDALVSALVEFQKAQVFFMLSVQIAILVALHNPSYIEAKNWQALWNNFGILYSLAFGGCLPVLFVLLMLRIAGKKEFYTLLVTLCSVALSSATWFVAWFRAPDPNTSIAEPESPMPDQCAGVAPIKYCYSGNIYYNATENAVKAVPMLVFCFVVLVCLMLDQVAVFTIRTQSGESYKGTCFQWLRHAIVRLPVCENYDRGAEGRPKWMRVLGLDTSGRTLRVVHGFLLFATECAFVALNMVLISDYAHLLTKGNDFRSLDTSSWSLGQIIAVTIWVPVLIEYVWQAYVGVEAGQKFRLPPGWRLVKMDDGRDVDDSDKIDPVNEMSSSIDLARLPAIGRPGYERVDSNNW
ncbi:hypothetical protein LTR86_000249 [Recurvomyces mirabilis]|nr:hypothetical protein LTR86_000249 [Recurvomyces mirabilis]